MCKQVENTSYIWNDALPGAGTQPRIKGFLTYRGRGGNFVTQQPPGEAAQHTRLLVSRLSAAMVFTIAMDTDGAEGRSYYSWIADQRHAHE